MPPANGHPALHPRHDRPCHDVPKRFPRLLFSAPFPRPAGVHGALCSARGAELCPLAQLRPQHLALRRHSLLRGALPQGKDGEFLLTLYLFRTFVALLSLLAVYFFFLLTTREFFSTGQTETEPTPQDHRSRLLSVYL